MVISSCHLKTTNDLKNAPEAISEGLKFKNFLGGHAPRPPYREHCRAQSLQPPRFSLSIILPPPHSFLSMKHWYTCTLSNLVMSYLDIAFRCYTASMTHSSSFSSPLSLLLPPSCHFTSLYAGFILRRLPCIA